MSSYPMEGVRVLEVAQFTYVPAAGGILADWGADVIKVEHPVAGDAQRGLQIGIHSYAEGSFSPIMEHPNRGKRSIGLALDDPAGREILYELARSSDIFLTNFLPDARERLLIDVEHIRAVNPKIIYVRGSAYGVRGPDGRKGGYDNSAFWARSGGALGATPPDAGRILSMPGPAYGDSIGAMTIAGGISAALFARERGRTPEVVDVSLLSTGMWAMGLAVDIALLSGDPMTAAPLASTPGAPKNPITGYYETSDGKWINLSMLQAGRYWADFCRHLGREDMVTDERWNNVHNLMANSLSAAAEVAAQMKTRTFREWVQIFKTLEGQWSPAQNAYDVGMDEQVRANDYIAQIVDSDGVQREIVANPVQFDETPPALRRAPQFAEHTDEILRELNRTEDEILQLKIDGVIT